VKVRFPVVTDEMHEWLLANRQSLITSTFVICHWCDHDWHANRCHNCTCESSRSRPDDTWRPKLGYTTPDLVANETSQLRAILVRYTFRTTSTRMSKLRTLLVLPVSTALPDGGGSIHGAHLQGD
jgi:hypothetical protein